MHNFITADTKKRHRVKGLMPWEWAADCEWHACSFRQQQWWLQSNTCQGLTLRSGGSWFMLPNACMNQDQRMSSCVWIADLQLQTTTTIAEQHMPGAHTQSRRLHVWVSSLMPREWAPVLWILGLQLQTATLDAYIIPVAWCTQLGAWKYGLLKPLVSLVNTLPVMPWESTTHTWSQQLWPASLGIRSEP